ncbi:hypothetical protein MBLNU459_g1015t1 [Dothideomycetes sp. NU459]
MAVVTSPFASYHYPSQSFGSGINMDQGVGSVQLVPNPQFVFPMQQPGQRSRTTSPVSRRPVSMRLDPLPHQGHQAQRQSVSTLPTFTFNATDTSGLVDGPAEPTSPSAVPGTPSKNMRHRRGASEFVGGDSRFGVSSMVNTSPAKPVITLPVPEAKSATGSPARGRGHAHRRSAAISSHDLSTILQPRDVNVPPQMGSTPQTPTDRGIPSEYFPLDKHVSETGLGDGALMHSQADTSSRPPSRPRVGFSENIEYIPRPLSTVSSETTSSASTIRGHAFGNSISSVISLGGMGTPSPRRARTPSPMNIMVPPRPDDMLSVESSKRPSLGDQAPRSQGKRPLSESAATSPNLSISIDAPTTPRLPPRKKNFLKLDRRRSEPSISVGRLAHSRLSSVSLQEPIAFGTAKSDLQGSEPLSQELRRKSSRKKVKEWATAFLGRKTRDPSKKSSITATTDNPPSPTPWATVSPSEPIMDAEPDLDALFSQDPFSADEAMEESLSPRIEISAPPSFPTLAFPSSRIDDSPEIDLDAALGPYSTPSMSWEARAISSSGGRRQLHSDRLNRDFGGPGMHYQRRNEHRRAESAPASAFTPFEFSRSISPSQSPMADVFEEEEEVAHSEAPRSFGDAQHEDDEDEDEIGTGIEVVDAVNEMDEPQFDWSFQDGLGIDRASMDGSAASSFATGFPQLTTPLSDRRPSIVEDTILEESSPIEIVEDYEEPRTSSLTKSSDSSEASTILADRANLILSVPPGHPSPLTPASYATSTFSSSDYGRREGSFEATRLGTSTSSVADSRTISSFATGEHGPETLMSVDDVPSLTSSRSTMISTMHASGRNFTHRSGSVVSERAESERRRKRSSIQSLSKLVSDSRSRLTSERRPQTAVASTAQADVRRKKENRLSKLMFWKSRSDSRNESLAK